MREVMTNKILNNSRGDMQNMALFPWRARNNPLIIEISEYARHIPIYALNWLFFLKKKKKLATWFWWLA